MPESGFHQTSPTSLPSGYKRHSSPHVAHPDPNNAASRRIERAPSKKLANSDYTVGWVAALPIERAAAEAMLDCLHQKLPKAPGDTNNYTFGEIGGHNVVIASLPHDGYGTINAATAAGNMHRTFPSLEVFLMVGIGGGAPAVDDVRLGDVVVSTKLIQYDLGKALGEGHFETTAIPLRPAQELRTAVAALQAQHEARPSSIPDILCQIAEQNPHMERYTCRESLQDFLFESAYEHPISESTCNQCNQSRLVKRAPRRSNNPIIHYGVIASGDQVIKYATTRDKLSQRFGALCFEMEGADFIESLQCLVIRSICDYADSHKNKQWQRYAAATAAAYTKELLGKMPIMQSQASRNVAEELSSAQKTSLMNSLSFKSMYSREWNIENPQNKTCEWILQHPTYSAWLDPEKYSQNHGFLWIRGKPGAGKSTLMKFIFKQALENHPTVVSFFFNARGGDLEKSVEGMYRSLLHQLLNNVLDLQLLDHPRLRHLASGNHFEWTIGSLQELFSHAIAGLGQHELVCFVDALDECATSQVRGMIKHFESLGNLALERKSKLFICLSSRHYPAISINAGLSLILEDQYGHSRDLEEYVDHKLDIDEGEDALEIKTELLKKAAGIFLWVVLVVDILNEDCSGGRMFGLKARLNEIPSELHALFRDILLKDDKNRADLLLSMQWILYAEGPLSPKEYYYAMASGLSPEEESLAEWDPTEVTINKINQFVSSSSKGLAEVTEYSIVQFIHESVRDFLIKDGGIHELLSAPDFQSRSHDRLKECCYAYIKAQPTYKIITTWGTDNKAPFLRYAATQVLYHANVAAVSVSQQDFLKTFDLKTWIRLQDPFPSRGYTMSPNIFYVLADQGFARLIDDAVVIHGPRVHVRGGIYEYPLFAALCGKHNEAVDAILRAGNSCAGSDDPVSRLPPNCETIVIEKYPKRYFTPLTLAVWAGHVKVVHLLLDQGLSPNIADPSDRIPLALAVAQASCELAQLLLDRGAEANLRDRFDNTPLFSAVKNQFIGNITLLLARGANINSKNTRGETALSYAAEFGQLQAVRLLLDGGANVDSKSKEGRTALSFAAEAVQPEVVRLFLDRGAKVDSKYRDGKSSLSFAAEKGQPEAVRLLLDGGAEVNLKDKDGRTALSFAAQYGRSEAIRLLLDGGAEVDSKDIDSKTALFFAAKYGKSEAVRLLLDGGADVDLKDKDGRTALSFAAENGQSEVVGLLLGRGANIDSKNKDGRTALSFAAENGRPEVVSILLDKGAKVDSRYQDGRSALLYANEQENLIAEWSSNDFSDTDIGSGVSKEELVYLANM